MPNLAGLALFAAQALWCLYYGRESLLARWVCIGLREHAHDAVQALWFELFRAEGGDPKNPPGEGGERGGPAWLAFRALARLRSDTIMPLEGDDLYHAAEWCEIHAGRLEELERARVEAVSDALDRGVDRAAWSAS